MKRILITGTNQISNAYPIGFVATLIMSIVMLIPDLKNLATEFIIAITFLWIPGMIMYSQKLPASLKRVLLWLGLYFLIVLIYKMLGISTAWWDIAAGYFGCTVCAVISSYSYYIFDTRQKDIIKWVIYWVSIFVLIYVSIKGRHDLAIMSVEEAISQENAVYGSSVMIFSGISLIGFLHSKNTKIKSAHFIAILLSLYVTMMIMQRGTNVVMTVILLGSILTFHYLKRIKASRIIFISGCVLIFLYYTGAVFAFIDYIANTISSERIAVRLKAINFVLQTGDTLDAGSSMTSRTELMKRSINTFLNSDYNVLLGVGDHRGRNMLIGNHSEILDTLARYGIFVFAILSTYFIKLTRWWYKMFSANRRLRYQICSIILIYLARNLWGNAMTSAISILLFLYLPLIVFPILRAVKLNTLTTKMKSVNSSNV